MTPAEYAKAQGWRVGDLLYGEERWGNGGGSDTVLRLLYIGQRVVIGNSWNYSLGRKETWHGEEGSWDLDCREWRRIGRVLRPNGGR